MYVLPLGAGGLPADGILVPKKIRDPGVPVNPDAPVIPVNPV